MFILFSITLFISYNNHNYNFNKTFAIIRWLLINKYKKKPLTSRDTQFFKYGIRTCGGKLNTYYILATVGINHIICNSVKCALRFTNNQKKCLLPNKCINCRKIYEKFNFRKAVSYYKVCFQNYSGSTTPRLPL